MRLAALLLTSLAFQLAACDASGPGASDATTGVVLNSNGYPVEAASLDFGEGRVCTTDASGRFACPPVGRGAQSVRVSADGYPSRTVTVTVPRSGDIGSFEALVLFSIPVAISLVSQASAPLGGVWFECRRRLLPSGRFGGVEFRAQVDAQNTMRAAAAFWGPGLCESVGDDAFRHWFAIIGTGQDGALALAATRPGTYAFVLTWGSSPANLDAHLTGPLGSDDRFHVHYGRLSFGPHRLTGNVSIGRGPETIFFAPDVPGTYRFSVHNQTMSTLPGLAVTGIINSPAVVRLFGPNGLSLELTPPAPSAQNGASTGNTWRVLQITRQSSGVLSSGSPAPTYAMVQNSGDGTQF